MGTECHVCGTKQPHWDHIWACCLNMQIPSDQLLRRFLWPRSFADFPLCEMFMQRVWENPSFQIDGHVLATSSAAVKCKESKGFQVVTIEECVGEVDIFTSATGNFKISGFEQRRHLPPTGPNVGVQSLQGDPAHALVNLLNFVENAIAFKYEHFALNDIVIETNDIGQNNILDVDMYGRLLDEGFNQGCSDPEG